MDNHLHGGEALARAVEAAYGRGQTDYSMEPLVLEDAQGAPVGRICNGDHVIFCCRRGEREVELTEAFTDKNFSHFPRPDMDRLEFAIMTMYHEKLKDLPIAFAPEQVHMPLAQVISKAGLRQFHCSESEKYAHVTFFFNGGTNQGFPDETDVMVPSPRGISFDQKPELSLPQVAGQVKKAVNEGYPFILTNFANGDVIGHTANTQAKIQAAGIISRQVRQTAEYARDHGYVVAITADHGNIEKLYGKEGKPDVSHTTNLVPFLLLDPQGRAITLRDGRLADVAPTILSILGLEKPPEMTGESLLTGPVPHSSQVMLIILDGWGIGTGDENDCLTVADTRDWDALLASYPHCRLRASGEDVGLKAGKAGNSEAGHTNLGAGRIVAQDDVRMDKAIQDGSFRQNPVFLRLLENAKKGGALHLIALLTEKSSHGCIDYPLMLTEMAEGVPEIYWHIIFDGRSTEPGSAPDLLRMVEEKLAALGRGTIVDGIGRGIALDRDGNYSRIQTAYESLVHGAGTRYRANPGQEQG